MGSGGFPPVHNNEYQQLDGLAIAEGIRTRRFSATEVMDCAIQLAESLNPSLNAITWQTYEQAREQAQMLDSASTVPDGPFSGVPFLIKDISPDGMLIETAIPIHATDIKIQASTGGEKGVEAEGIVIYSMQTAAETFRTGIGFRGPPQKSKQFVTSILRACQSDR